MFAAWFDLAMFRDAAVLAVWLTLLGAIVGSFLNVVVYRLPAGKSLIYPGSHCPHCSHAIRWYDNLPVVGWFVLRGRCRNCRAAISPRYPAVEALTALMFLSVALTHVVYALPDSVTTDADFALILRRHLARFAYLVTLLCCLQVAALIRYDGQRLPASLLWFGLIVGVFAPLVWPHVKGFEDRADVGATIVLGATVGLVSAMLVGLVVRWTDETPGLAIEVGAVLLGVGIYLNAPTAGFVALTATFSYLFEPVIRLFWRVERQRLPWIVFASFVTWYVVFLRFSL